MIISIHLHIYHFIINHHCIVLYCTRTHYFNSKFKSTNLRETLWFLQVLTK